MKKIAKQSFRSLYILWAVFYLVDLTLGFLFPQAEGWPRTPLLLLSILFFLPPWIILHKAKKEHRPEHSQSIFRLSLASLGFTLLVLILSFRSLGKPQSWGAGLHAALNIVSVPMICSNYYIIPLFLWASLLMGSLNKCR